MYYSTLHYVMLCCLIAFLVYCIFRFAEVQTNASQLDNNELVVAMATCHSLTTLNGTIAGDPLDVHMFEATGWVRCYCECIHVLLLSATNLQPDLITI
jgi:magnesium-transporting ATPase (P-type)